MSQNNNFNYIFERVEKKYMLSEILYKRLLKSISDHMSADEYGLSTICNIYYDTPNYDLIRNSIEKPVYKEKLRLRGYGAPSKKDTVFLEIKKKYKGVVYKRRISLSLQEASNYLNNGIKPSSRGQILNEIDYFIGFYKPEPKLFLAYDRIAYFDKENPSLRITFDNNIRSREYDLNMEKGTYGETLLNDGFCLMEVKTTDSMPLWLVRILSELAVYPKSFSKYGNIYKENLIENRRRQKCLQVF
jgi:hypothetical protein